MSSHKPLGPVGGQTGFVMNLASEICRRIISQMYSQQEMLLTFVSNKDRLWLLTNGKFHFSHT